MEANMSGFRLSKHHERSWNVHYLRLARDLDGFLLRKMMAVSASRKEPTARKKRIKGSETDFCHQYCGFRSYLEINRTEDTQTWYNFITGN